MKTIIIDDRKERKHQFWDDVKKEQATRLCQKGVLEIRETMGTFDETKGVFDELEKFQLIAVHESLLKETNRLEELIDYAKGRKKLLILFSGGITHNGIYDSGRLMRINAEDFYNKVLPFVEENQNNDKIQLPLLQFLYGADWRLPLLLRYRDLIWNYGSALDDPEENPEYQIEEEIRAILLPGDDVISPKWIEDELIKYRKAL